MGRIKSRFVRALVETLQQETSGSALTRLRHGLPPHWLRVLSRDVFGRVEQDAALELSAGLDLLYAIERTLSGGTGKLITRAASALISRVLYGSTGLVVAGDFVRTLRHLRAPFEQPFTDTDVHFRAHGSALEVSLELQLPGVPGAARWLSWTGLGYAQAAASFSGHDPLHFRFDTRLDYDLACVTGRRTNTGLVELPGVTHPFPSRPPAPRRRTPPTNAAARVDEILSRAQVARAAEAATPSLAQLRAEAQPRTDARLRAEPRRASGPVPARSGTRAALRTEALPLRNKAR